MDDSLASHIALSENELLDLVQSALDQLGPQWRWRALTTPMAWDVFRDDWPQDRWERSWYRLWYSSAHRTFVVEHGGGQHGHRITLFHGNPALTLPLDVLFYLRPTATRRGTSLSDFKPKPSYDADSAAVLRQFIVDVLDAHPPNVNNKT
jgi:hypothetical protein